MKQRRNRSLVLLVVLFILAACGGGGGGGSGANSAPEGLPANDLQALIASGGIDSDGDGIPDAVERDVLGTDPYHVDTDRDGINDYVEIFGSGSGPAIARIQDRDLDGVIAPLDADDDGDGINDGEFVDSDADGIPDYLELYGFVYDRMTGRFLPWGGQDYSVPYYKTDPRQKSTDQDPYDDDVEVTGTHMDVSVKSPGGLPMVPAVPKILIRLEGYSVTLNQDITWTEGRTLSSGTSWTSSTAAMHSHTEEHTWDLGYATQAGFSPDGLFANVTFHANYGGRVSKTHETTTSYSLGGSNMTEEQWSKAYTTNPTDAARIKLFLKMYNQGTAIASNVVPTLTLRIGGHNVATFEPGNAQVNLLKPGGVYPAEPGVYWVVDTVDTGAGVLPLSLTLNELRALECGAPISITLTQMSADVMRRNPSTGSYESVGNWNEYLARCESVSANLYFEVGDGNFVHSMVYAGEGPYAPRVTLGDAFLWGIGGNAGFGGSGIGFSYTDLEELAKKTMDLENWHICVDGATYAANGYPAGSLPPPGFDPFGLVLRPGSTIVAKAPRETVPGVTELPEIYYAYFDSSSSSVNAVVADYNGIAAVQFVDKNGTARAMKPDIKGSSFYVYYPMADVTAYPSGYTFSGEEFVRVTNLSGNTAEQVLTGVYVPVVPTPVAPAIEWVYLDVASRYVEAMIVENVDYPAQWVRAYHPTFQNGYIEMELVSDWFRRPNRWCFYFPENLNISVEEMENVDVVAWVQSGVYSFSKPTVTYRPYNMGKVDLHSYYGWYATDEWYSDALDLDDSSVARFYWDSGRVSGETFPRPHSDHELWVIWDDYVDGRWELRFNTGILSREVTELTFSQITHDHASAMVLEDMFQYPLRVGDVYVLKTNAGRLAKIRILETAGYDPSGYQNKGMRTRIELVVFE